MTRISSLRTRKRLLITILFSLVVLPAALNQISVLVEAVDASVGQITFRVYPDEIVEIISEITVRGTLSSWETKYSYESMTLSVETESVSDNETNVQIDYDIKLDASLASALANLDFELSLESSSPTTEINLHTDYPGYVGLDGTLTFTVTEPPFEGVLDLEMDVTLYYALYPREQVEQTVVMFPMMKTELASMIADSSDGEVVLTKLELISSEMGEASATFKVEMTLEGNFGTGIQSGIQRMESSYSDVEVDLEEITYTEIESYSVDIIFEKETFTFKVTSEGTIRGDLDAQMNALKDLYLDEALEEDSLDEDERAMITEVLKPTELSITDSQVTFWYSVEGNETTASFETSGLLFKPPSHEQWLELLQEAVDDAEESDMKLIIEGGEKGNECIVVNVPDETTTPESMEPQRVEWSLDGLENIDKVTFEVETQGLSLTGNTTLMAGAVIAGIVVSVVAIKQLKLA
ncbi:MAG: hypothetical protein NWE89_16525 [Candidatus Bathyarchaeota archaeon]|nr:hypothetical protein [Candidatus Bathyarchaeota archaeon]